MEINLKEGEQITIRAKKGTSFAYRTLVCYKNCILLKKEADAVKPKRTGTTIIGVEKVDDEFIKKHL